MSVISNRKSNYKILLAEDNILNQKLICTVLKKNNFDVITALNGEEACQLHNSEKPDLILMDVEMPDVNGYEAVARIRETEKNNAHRVPILALTGHYLQEDIDNIFKCGMDDYISKPIKFESFVNKISSFLGVSDNCS
jgi:CheY-like chemotaxis protein